MKEGQIVAVFLNPCPHNKEGKVKERESQKVNLLMMKWERDILRDGFFLLLLLVFQPSKNGARVGGVGLKRAI